MVFDGNSIFQRGECMKIPKGTKQLLNFYMFVLYKMADFLYQPDSNVKKTILISKCNDTRLEMDTIPNEMKCRPLSELDGVSNTTIFNYLREYLQETINKMKKERQLDEEMERQMELEIKEEN